MRQADVVVLEWLRWFGGLTCVFCWGRRRRKCKDNKLVDAVAPSLQPSAEQRSAVCRRELKSFSGRPWNSCPIFPSVVRYDRQNWHMYPLRLLIGLGFDTSTEIGILSISATEASMGLPVLPTLVFPALFAAGMSLVDTTDSMLMVGAYGWAFVKPVRKLYYNMTITLVLVIVALVVGGIEALGLFGSQFHLDGVLWSFVRRLNDNFDTLGFYICVISQSSAHEVQHFPFQIKHQFHNSRIE